MRIWRIGEAGYQGHCMNVFGTLQDMVEALDYLAACARETGVA